MSSKNKDNPCKSSEALGVQRHYIYMVSIHKHQKKDFVCKYDLDNVLNKLLASLASYQPQAGNIVYEMTAKYCQLHLHCILKVARDFRYYRYTKSNGFRVHFTKVYDLIGIQSYLSKQVTCHAKQDQILDENFYTHNYGFVTSSSGSCKDFTTYDKRTRSMI